MAVYNEILTGGLNQILARRLGVQTGGGAVAPSIAPEIFAMLALEVDRPEWKFLAGERLVGASSGASAMAVVNSYVALSNPAGSNVLAIVERIRVEMGAGSTVAYIFMPNTSLSAGTPVNTTVLDGRWYGAATFVRGALQCSTSTTGGVPAFTSFYVQEASSVRDYDSPIVLPPGTGIGIVAVTANVAIPRVTFSWRERAAVSGELG
jgi:hypothetical protein